MKAASLIRLPTTLQILATLGLLTLTALASPTAADDSERGLRLHSATFKDGETLPLLTLSQILLTDGKTNMCSQNGLAAGDQSPELSWTGAPHNTRSFVVVVYDITAAFTHWGMYNLAAGVTELPPNAGIAGSSYGAQILNDFFDISYDGPCANTAPFVHHYRFTVYALDRMLTLPASANFPANAETLYQALIEAGRHDHILDSATITGLSTTTPTS